MTTKILFITAGDRSFASSRLRVYEVIPHLEQKGYTCDTICKTDYLEGEITLSDKISFAHHIISLSPFYDWIYIQKVRFPPWFTKLLSVLPISLIYDFDDAIYKSAPGRQVTNGKIKSLNTLLKESDIVIAGSSALASYAADYSSQVFTVSTGIPRQDYVKNRTDPYSSNGIILGWIGNSRNLHYLVDVENVISEVLRSHEDMKLRIITEKDTEVRPFEDLGEESVRYIEWSLESALSDLTVADVGIRPLRDDEWTRSKGGFTSIIECLALGLPVIANPIGMVSEYIQDGYNGYLVSDNSEWRTTLSRLPEEKEHVQKMGRHAIESVSEMNFWSENKAEQLDNIIDGYGGKDILT